MEDRKPQFAYQPNQISLNSAALYLWLFFCFSQNPSIADKSDIGVGVSGKFHVLAGTRPEASTGVGAKTEYRTVKLLFSMPRTMLVLATVMLTTAIGWDVMAEDDASHLKLDRNSDASQAYSLIEARNLSFHATKLNEFRWFEESKPLSGWDKYSIFEKVSLQLIGYDPANRDEFEIQVITAEIKPEKVARGVDYARLFATEDGGSVSEMKEYGRDKGDVSAIGPDDGFNRRERVTAWRQGKSLLIIKASYLEEKAKQVEPEIAKFMGSVKLDTKVTDSIEDAMHWEKLPARGDAVYAARLPDGWKQFAQNSDPNSSYTGSIFTNSNDPDGNSAVSLFIFPTQKSNLSPTDEQLRQLAAKVVEIELQSLMPDVGFKLDQDVSFVPDEKIGNTDRGFIDNITLQGSGEKIRARTLLTVKGDVVAAVASLTAFPATPKDIATMIHTDFVTRTIELGLVDQLK